MSTKLFVSLAYTVTEDELRDFFSEVGTVESARVIMDRETGRSKGFGFVEMSSDAEAKAAIDKLNGRELSGRAVSVSEARPQENRERRSFNNDNTRRY